MTPLGFGLGLGFNRGGVSNESAPDIERNGLVFNLDASDISKLYRNIANQGDTPIYVPATVNSVVNRIVCQKDGSSINIETPTITEAYTLKQDVNGKYYLTADPLGNGTNGIVAYTTNGVPASSAPAIASNNNLVVVTWGSTVDGNAVMLSMIGATGSIAVGRYNNEYFAGNTTSGLRYALTGISPMQVRAINNKENNWFAYDGLTEKITPTGSWNLSNFTTIGGRVLSTINRYNLLGIQVYSAYANTPENKAKVLEIVNKAIAYYGVA